MLYWLHVCICLQLYNNNNSNNNNTFGLECRALACKKNTICKKVEGGGARSGGQAPPPAPPRPPPMPWQQLTTYVNKMQSKMFSIKF